MKQCVGLALVLVFCGAMFLQGCRPRVPENKSKAATVHSENDGHDHSKHSKDDGHGHSDNDGHDHSKHSKDDGHGR